MNIKKKVAIVGGGASGLFTAIDLLSGSNAFLGDDIVILEKNDRVGKKLLVTGNGQCNLSNTDMCVSHYYGDKGFINAFFGDKVDLVEYLKHIGIYTCADENGKVYPLSLSASSVLDIIRQFLISKNVEIITSCEVTDIKKENDLFKLETSKGVFYSKYVVSAFGGKSGKQFGTDGKSYKLLENFKHKITNLYPSLVQLKTDTKYIKGLKGVKEKVRLSAYHEGKLLKTVVGDLLFTDYGVSGDSVFKISSVVTDKNKCSLSIEFLPDESKEELESIIESKKKLPFIDKNDILTGIVNKRVGQMILKRSGSNKTEDILKQLKGYKLEVTGTAGFDQSQVTKGGIETDFVNPFTMKSKLVDNLFIIGESLNVDGDCGGYNLTFAFTSGIKASKTIKNFEDGEKI